MTVACWRELVDGKMARTAVTMGRCAAFVDNGLPMAFPVSRSWLVCSAPQSSWVLSFLFPRRILLDRMVHFIEYTTSWDIQTSRFRVCTRCVYRMYGFKYWLQWSLQTLSQIIIVSFLCVSLVISLFYTSHTRCTTIAVFLLLSLSACCFFLFLLPLPLIIPMLGWRAA